MGDRYEGEIVGKCKETLSMRPCQNDLGLVCTRLATCWCRVLEGGGREVKGM